MTNVQTEMEFENLGAEPPEAETKAEKFSRVVNHRLSVAVERLRMIGQMFDGANANNYEFTNEQISTMSELLQEEVSDILSSAYRVLEKREGRAKRAIPQI